MDEAMELSTYLPRSFANADEQKYLEFLWSAFNINYEAERYEFASFAFHLLYMSFVSFSIWQIRLARPDQFAMAMVGFRKEEESKLKDCNSPFKFYDRLKESQIFRFLKLIDCTNEQVGEFSKFVKRRNKIAHPAGNVFFNDCFSIDNEITKMMTEVQNIQAHMQPVIHELYSRFLKDSADLEGREFAESGDEVTANLVHVNYMSTADLEHCKGLDFAEFNVNPNQGDIGGLHQVLLSMLS